jgi:hypothetical protein
MENIIYSPMAAWNEWISRNIHAWQINTSFIST